MRTTLLATAFLVFSTLPATAADLIVTPGASIQAAIDAAFDGDRVLVQAGTYTEVIDFTGKAISVIGVSGATQTILDGMNGSTAVVTFQNDEGPGSVLQGFTLQNGDASGIDGLNLNTGDYATATILDCIVRDNRGSPGGGISRFSGTIERTAFFDNTAASADGGAIFGAPTLRHCVMASNVACLGGGISVVGGDSVIEDCLILDNEALDSGRGGGIYVSQPDKAIVSRTVIAGNISDAFGISGRGSGVFVSGSDVGNASTFDNCTIVNNLAADYNDGIANGGVFGPIVLRNSIVYGNDAEQIGFLATVEYSNVEGGFAGTGNIDVDSGFVDAAGLDFHLASGSLVIDQGDPLLTDPDGSPLDMGAFPFAQLYTRGNIAAADWVDPNWPVVSALVGGKQTMKIQVGAANAGKLYAVLGSTSGTSPGLSLFGVQIPLNVDGYLLSTLGLSAAPLTGAFGLLDGSGAAEATVTLAADPAAVLAGFQVHHAALVGSVGPFTVDFSTNALAVDIE